MILYNNFEFFNKKGHNLNLKKIYNISIEIIDNTNTENAKLEVLTNHNNEIEKIGVIKGGLGYSDNVKIIIKDNNTNNNFVIEGTNFIIKNNDGSINNVILPYHKSGFTFPSFYYEGNLFFDDEISVGLTEVENIFISEVIKNNLNELKYIYPRYSLNHNGIYNDKLNIKLDGDDDIFLFTVDKNGNYPSIIKKYDYNIELEDGTNDTIDNQLYRVTNINYNSTCQINIGLQSDDEGVYESYLYINEIYNNREFIIAKILIHGEVIGEDERLDKLLENFGLKITETEAKIFKDADVNEVLPNYKLLNEKRKELLLEYHNIFPYIGSYKALKNILKFFDYSDLTIKEYWLNVSSSNNVNSTYRNLTNVNDIISFINKQNISSQNKFKYNHYKQLDVDDYAQINDLIKSNNWKKTNLFSLHYNINKVTDNYENNLPIVIDDFLYSEDEVLMKLFSLKKYLENKFLPLNAHIIDITGDGIYFDRYVLNTWSDNTNTFYVNKEFTPSFDIITSGYIEDIEDYSNSLFNNINYIDTNNELHKDDCLIGCKVNLVFDDNLIKWCELNDAWYNLLNTWTSINHLDYYELEWTIKYENPNKFYYNKRYNINDGRNINIVLPYIGSYDIELTLYDMTNAYVKARKKIDINIPELFFTMMYKYHKPINNWKETNNISWYEFGGNWANPEIMNDTKWNNINVSWNDLSVQKYLYDFNDKIVKNDSYDIIKVNEANRYVGKLFYIDKSNNIIKCYGQYIQPPLRNKTNVINDYIYFVYDNIVHKVGVVNADYSENNITKIELEYIPNGINTNWQCLREIGNQIIINGHIDNNTKFVICEPDKNKPLYKNIKINDIIDINYNNYPQIVCGIQLDSIIEKRSNEYGKIYKIRNTNSITFINDNIIQLNYSLEPNEIIPGFTFITMTSIYNNELYTQHLQVENINGNQIKIVELDGDINLNNNATIEYKYYEFTVKTVHYENGNSNKILLNFNNYNYHNDFVINNNNIYQLNGDWYFDYNIKENEYTLEVTNISYDNDNTILTINDKNNELYLLSSSFKLRKSDFDVDYAKKWIGLNNINWQSLDNISWQELDHLWWDDFEYSDGALPYFKILDIANGGTININDNDIFMFHDLPFVDNINVTEDDYWQFAVNELNNYDGNILSKFEYILYKNINTTPTEYCIYAISKYKTTETLGYIKFDNGCIGEYIDPLISHSYPIGAWANWNDPHLYGYHNYHNYNNIISRKYYEYGQSPSLDYGWYPSVRYKYDDYGNIINYIWLPDKYKSINDDPNSYKMLYTSAINGSFNYNNLYISNKKVTVNKYTTIIFLLPTDLKIYNIKKYLWKIINYDTNEILIECNAKNLIWTFANEGIYNIYLEIIDNNGNKKNICKNGFVEIK